MRRMQAFSNRKIWGSLAAIAVVCAAASLAQAEPVSTSKDEIEARGKAAAEALKTRDDPEMMSRAQSAADAARADDMRAMVEAMGPRVLRALGVSEDEATGRTDDVPPVRPRLAPLVFASSSIPLSTLRNLAAQLERVGGSMVFRGSPGGLEKLGPMVGLTQAILKVDPACEGASCSLRNVGVLIDPMLFRTHDVTAVPAVVLVDRDPFEAYCERRADEAPAARFVSYGDAHLTGHLDALDRLGDARARVVSKAYSDWEQYHDAE